MRRLPLLITLCLWHGVTIAAAQTDCPTIVNTALQAADELCTDLGRNQVCYGNITLEATAYRDAASFIFDVPGDIADVGAIEALQLSSMSLEDETWGIALMSLQANLPNSIP